MKKRRSPHPGGRPTLGYGAKHKTSLALTAEATAIAERAAEALSDRLGMSVSVADVFEAAIRAFNVRRFKPPAARKEGVRG